MNKKEAGRLGGLKTVERYGKAHMSEIGKLGYLATRNRYDLVPVGTSQWGLVRKSDGKLVKVW